MEILTINGNHYHHENEINKLYPDFFPANKKDIVSHHNLIPYVDFTYVRLGRNKKLVQIIDIGKPNPSDKILISVSWFDSLSNIPKVLQSPMDILANQKHINSMSGISISSVIDTLELSPQPIPCVYLLILGNVHTLRNSFNIHNKIPNNYLIAKYGYTVNLLERLKKHQKDYQQYDGVKINIKLYSRVDPVMCRGAEDEIKKFVDKHNLELNFPKRKELIIFPPEFLNKITKKYKNISNEFSDQQLINKIKELENITIINELKTKDLNNQLKILNTKLKKQTNKLKNKDIEIEALIDTINSYESQCEKQQNTIERHKQTITRQKDIYVSQGDVIDSMLKYKI